MSGPVFERAHSTPRLSLGSLSFRKDADEDSEDFLWVDIPFSSLHGEDCEELGAHRPHQKGFYFQRQFYLHSFQFRRKKSMADRLRGSIRRVKAATWAILACHYRPKKIKEKLKCIRKKDGHFLCCPSCFVPANLF